MQGELEEKSAYGLGKRARRSVQRLFGWWHRPGYDVRFVLENGQPKYKKVVFHTPDFAKQVFVNLEEFRDSEHFPTPQSANIESRSVTVDFVKGHPPEVGNVNTLGALAKFYAAVFRQAPRLLPMEQSGVWEDFEKYLATLCELQRITTEDAAKLRERAASLAPAQIWIGFDYIDPILRNLLVRESSGAICGIDLKNLRAEQPLGTGLAKGQSKWLTALDIAKVFAGMRQAGAPDIEPYFEFIRLFERVRRYARKRKKKTNYVSWLVRSKIMTFED